MDGTPTLRLNEFILGSLAAKKAHLGAPRSDETGKGLSEPTELKFVVDDKVKGHVQRAEQAFDELVGQHDMHVRYSPSYLIHNTDVFRFFITRDMGKSTSRSSKLPPMLGLNS